MSTLIDDTTEAATWVDQVISERLQGRGFGKMVSAVLWVNNPDQDAEPVGGDDPTAFIDEINAQGWPIFRGHDPGYPVGRTIAAKLFTSPGGARFVAAILALYKDESRLSFRELSIDPSPVVSSPNTLQALDGDYWLDFATDPREVDSLWVDEVLSEAPLKVNRVELSHNSAEPQSELIRIGMIFAALVWNPLVTTVSTEAGKDIYTGIRKWLRNFWNKLADCKKPVVVVQSYQDGCEVSFLFRGKTVKENYDAHDALPLAAVQAAKLIANMKTKGVAPLSLVYEFDEARWFPSYATLEGGQIISDRTLLIAVEQLPKGLSIGVRK